MSNEDRIADLADRTHRLELLDELDKQGAKAERENRTAQKREIDVERKTLRVSEDDRLDEYPVSDPIKWYNMIHAGILYRFRGVWRVRTDVARAMGYDVVED